MTRSHSPGYPNFPLPKAIELIRKIYSADRRNPIDRVVAAKHCGYSGLSGAADKSLGSLAHYDLLERAGKGQARVTQAAVDILHPDPLHPEQRKQALQRAAFSPSIFEAIRTNFSDGLPSEAALRSWLMREEFLDRAISPVTKAYLETCLYLEQEKAIESGGPSATEDVNPLDANKDDADSSVVKFGGTCVGDLIDWEVNGALANAAPMRITGISDDHAWVFVNESQSGLPMEQVIVKERAAAPATSIIQPPANPFIEAKQSEESVSAPKGHRSEKFDADEGVITISWPSNLSTQSVEDMQAWVELLMKRIERRAKAGEGPEKVN